MGEDVPARGRGQTLIGILSFFTLGIILFWLVWDKSKQELWDKVVGTIVVDDPSGILRTQGFSALPPAGMTGPIGL